MNAFVAAQSILTDWVSHKTSDFFANHILNWLLRMVRKILQQTNTNKSIPSHTYTHNHHTLISLYIYSVTYTHKIVNIYMRVNIWLKFASETNFSAILHLHTWCREAVSFMDSLWPFLVSYCIWLYTLWG